MPDCLIHLRSRPLARGVRVRDKQDQERAQLHNLLTAPWGHRWEDANDSSLKAPPAGSQLSAACPLRRPSSGPQVLASQAWAAESPPRGWVPGTAKLSARAGHGLVLGAHSAPCRAVPVSRRRWVLLVRVALGGFLVESGARRGRFLLVFLRLCACSDAVRAEIL